MGVILEIIDDRFMIIDVVLGGPAEQVGLRSGDIILAVDDEILPQTEKITDLIGRLLGRAGREIRLQIEREGAVLDFVLTRTAFKIPTLYYRNKRGVPIIRIINFAPDTEVRFREIYHEKFRGQNFPGLIIDVRGNSGGYFRAATQLLEWFATEGEGLFWLDRGDRQSEIRSSQSGELAGQSKVVILQNKVTASAAEIFSGFFAATDHGTVLGNPSRGKGTIQRVVNYPDGSVLKLTTAKWFPPDRVSVEGVGVMPDIETVSRTSLERNLGRDPVLDQAIEFVLAL